MSVIKNPVTMSTLLRGYTGRRYVDASQETPGQALEEDVTPAEVRVEPDASRKRTVRDKWERRGDTLVRIHGTPRLTLFTPDKVQECPVRESSFTGKRRTFVQATGGTKQQLIEDDYKSEGKPNRGLLERWTGETHFELKGEPFAEFRSLRACGSPRCGSLECICGSCGTSSFLRLQFLLLLGLCPELRDSWRQECRCHQTWRKKLPDRPRTRAAVTAAPAVPLRKSWSLTELLRWSASARLRPSSPARACRRICWRLRDEEKLEFDEAQAVELSNVLSSAAVRALAMSETKDLDYSKVMKMRWVLTRKNSGTAKARLVVLGFQQHNLTTVQTAAPTLSRTGRYALLAAAANKGFKLESGDVTSAFLQTMDSLEDEQLFVWAPAELAALFGAEPGEETVLKLTKAFYGLVHAPRKWHESVVEVLLQTGWKQTKVDRCLFCLYDDGTQELIALVGIHVDDFLICGQPGHEKYEEAKRKLQAKFKFGKWCDTDFEFAGCHLRQKPDGIYVDQEDYVNKWLEEIPMTKQRSLHSKSALTSKEISQLRAVLGTLSWKASQTGPCHQAEVSLLLSSVPGATVHTANSVNKLVREVRREASQQLWFPFWNLEWRSIATVVWADASQGNRPKKASTIGYVAGYAPRSILDGEEEHVALVSWRSTKAPRGSLGSNGSEVQAITVGEDVVFLLRAVWFELHGGQVARGRLEHDLAHNTTGGLMMDSRGVFDAMTRNLSSLHGLRSSRAGYELVIAVQQALKLRTHLRWVNGLAMLADGLTKAGNKKDLLNFFVNRQRWSIIHDESFTAGKKLHKVSLQKKLAENVECFLTALSAFARQSDLPQLFDEVEEPVEDEGLMQNLRGFMAMSEGAVSSLP